MLNIENRLRFLYAYIFPKRYSEHLFWHAFQRKINWKFPRDYNEKVQYSKFYSDTRDWPKLADKYRVREYVEQCGFEYMLNDLYAKYDKIEDIDIKKLPSSFVLKANDRCGGILIVRDKSKINNEEVKAYFKRVFKTRYGVLSAEPHYRKIKQCVIAEKLLQGDCSISKSSLIDYKFLCFGGIVKYVLVCFDRNANNEVKTLIFDLNWNPYPNNMAHAADAYPVIPKPKSLDEMIRAASILSKPFPLLRVDFYEINGKPVFGELTFTPAAGVADYYTNDFLLELGSYVTF